MSLQPSSSVLPSLLTRLRESGQSMAIATLASRRFERYLKRSADLLRDGWSLCSGERASDHVLYRLGSERMVHQVLRYQRSLKTMTLTTVDPRHSYSQTVVFDLRTRRVVKNEVSHQSERGYLRHAFCGEPGHERLHRINEEVAA